MHSESRAYNANVMFSTALSSTNAGDGFHCFNHIKSRRGLTTVPEATPDPHRRYLSNAVLHAPMRNVTNK